MIMISYYIVFVTCTCSVMEFPSSSSPKPPLPSRLSFVGAAACTATSLDSAADSSIFVSAKKLQYELSLKEQGLTELVNVRASVWEIPSLNSFVTLVYGLYGQVAQNRVISPEMFSQVVRNAELCQCDPGPSIPITICRPCFFWSKITERDILLIYRACFVVNQGLKSEIYYTFIPLVSPHHRLKNEECYTFIPLIRLMMF